MNPVEVEVIRLFVQLSRALVHPCKIYKILAVAAPVLYIGPTPSHITEILDRLGERYPRASCPHGETNHVADQIVAFMDGARNGPRKVPAEATTAFAKGTLLPRMIEELEKLKR